jgi:hypothetical protein
MLANAASNLDTIRLGNQISRSQAVKYLIHDTKINRATLRLDRGIITVSQFLKITSYVSYNPARHCALARGPPGERVILAAKRRLGPPPATQNIDSDSC